jgi:adenosylcobyric acid synthase
VVDPDEVEGGDSTGLGLLDLDTVMDADKLTHSTRVGFAGLPPAWERLEGRAANGYEIRNGRVSSAEAATGDDRVWADGAILATTVHGLLEDPEVLHALVGVRPPPVLERTFELLADAVDASLDTDLLWSMVRS